MKIKNNLLKTRDGESRRKFLRQLLLAGITGNTIKNNFALYNHFNYNDADVVLEILKN